MLFACAVNVEDIPIITLLFNGLGVPLNAKKVMFSSPDKNFCKI